MTVPRERAVRELESEWVGSGRDVPPAVRAMWFLSSVLVNGKASRLNGKVLHRATSEKGTTADVRAGLELLMHQGETAAVLLDELPPKDPPMTVPRERCPECHRTTTRQEEDRRLGMSENLKVLPCTNVWHTDTPTVPRDETDAAFEYLRSAIETGHGQAVEEGYHDGPATECDVDGPLIAALTTIKDEMKRLREELAQKERLIRAASDLLPKETP